MGADSDAGGGTTAARGGAEGRVLALLSIHIRDELRHEVRDTCKSVPMAVLRVDPQNHLKNGLSCTCFTISGQIQRSSPECLL